MTYRNPHGRSVVSLAATVTRREALVRRPDSSTISGPHLSLWIENLARRNCKCATHLSTYRERPPQKTFRSERMNSKFLRGTGLSRPSIGISGDQDLAPRMSVTFACPKDHDFTVP